MPADAGICLAGEAWRIPADREENGMCLQACIVTLVLAATSWSPSTPLPAARPDDQWLTPVPAPTTSPPVLPLERRPPGTARLPELQPRRALIPPRPQRAAQAICAPVSSPVTRNGKVVPRGVAFPALDATPPKLWQDGRCEGEGMR